MVHRNMWHSFLLPFTLGGLLSCPSSVSSSSGDLDPRLLLRAGGFLEFTQGTARLLTQVTLPDEEFPGLVQNNKMMSTWEVAVTEFPAGETTVLKVATLDRWGIAFGSATSAAIVGTPVARFLRPQSDPLIVQGREQECSEEGCAALELKLNFADFEGFGAEFDAVLVGENTDSFGTVSAVASSPEFSCSYFGELNGDQIQDLIGHPESSFGACVPRREFEAALTKLGTDSR